MSFFTKLGKSFIRSAVNQVGRDGGRVVSNKVYGDSHAIKIKSVNNEPVPTPSSEVTIHEGQNLGTLEGKYFEDRKPLIENGFKVSYFKFGLWLLLMPLSALIPFIGPLIMLLGSILIIVSLGKTSMKAKYQSAVYKADKRYKDGTRFVGYETKKVTVLTNAKPFEVIISVVELIYTLSILAGSAYLTYYMFWGEY